MRAWLLHPLLSTSLKVSPFVRPLLRADAVSWSMPSLRECAREHPRRRRRAIRYGAGFEIAEAVDALIGANYPPADVWAMTPRQIAGALYFERRREAAEQLALVSSRPAVNRAR
jgi:hypothetical protein